MIFPAAFRGLVHSGSVVNIRIGTPMSVVRSILSSGGWSRTEQSLPATEPPFNQQMLWGANQNFVAFTAGMKGGNRVLLVDCRNWSAFQVRRPDGLFSIEFSNDGQSLLLLSRIWSKDHKNFNDFIDAVSVSTHTPIRFKGWFVSSYNHNVLFLNQHGEAKIFDTNLATFRGAEALTYKVKSLLLTRRDPAVRSPKPSTDIDRELPSGQPSQIRAYAFSPNLQIMCEMRKWYEGPPNNEQVEVGGHNDFVRDVLFDAHKHIYWTIRHPDDESVKGFRFLNHSKKIQFMTQEPIATGRSELKNYPSGIYTVDLQTGRVNRTALSKELSTIYSAIGHGTLAQD